MHCASAAGNPGSTSLRSARQAEQTRHNSSRTTPSARAYITHRSASRYHRQELQLSSAPPGRHACTKPPVWRFCQQTRMSGEGRRLAAACTPPAAPPAAPQQCSYCDDLAQHEALSLDLVRTSRRGITCLPSSVPSLALEGAASHPPYSVVSLFAYRAPRRPLPSLTRSPRTHASSP